SWPPCRSLVPEGDVPTREGGRRDGHDQGVLAGWFPDDDLVALEFQFHALLFLAFCPVLRGRHRGPAALQLLPVRLEFRPGGGRFFRFVPFLPGQVRWTVRRFRSEVRGV